MIADYTNISALGVLKMVQNLKNVRITNYYASTYSPGSIRC